MAEKLAVVDAGVPLVFRIMHRNGGAGCVRVAIGNTRRREKGIHCAKIVAHVAMSPVRGGFRGPMRLVPIAWKLEIIVTATPFDSR